MIEPSTLKTGLTFNPQDVVAIQTFFQRSRYELLQVLIDGEWSSPWTFAPKDVRAAEKAALMVGQYAKSRAVSVIRHARRVRVVYHGEAIEIIVWVEYPARKQIVLKFDDGSLIGYLPFLEGVSTKVFIAMFN